MNGPSGSGIRKYSSSIKNRKIGLRDTALSWFSFSDAICVRREETPRKPNSVFQIRKIPAL